MYKLVAALVCALVVAIFAVQNYQVVAIRFLGWQFDVSLAVVIMIATVVGAVFVFFLGIYQQISHSLKLREQRKRISVLEKELQETKNSLLDEQKKFAEQKDIMENQSREKHIAETQEEIKSDMYSDSGSTEDENSQASQE